LDYGLHAEAADIVLLVFALLDETGDNILDNFGAALSLTSTQELRQADDGDKIE
jgi:hypothetical protein